LRARILCRDRAGCLGKSVSYALLAAFNKSLVLVN
jgi:hypothetical protein